jgi:hypothetical protein
MIITNVKGPNTGQKSDVFAVFELTLRGAAAPVRNIYEHVFA